MRTVFQLTSSSKTTMLILALLAWSGIPYVYFTGDKVGFWFCLFGIPAATWATIFTLTTRYIVDDTGLTVTGKLVSNRLFRWKEIVKVTCTRIKPFSIFPTEIRYKLETRPPSPGKFAPYVNLSTDNIENANQLIREIQAHLPPSVRDNTDWELK